MHTQSVIRQQLHALDVLVCPEMLSQGSQVGLSIAQTGNEHISHPEGASVLLQPFGCTQGLRIGTLRDGLVPFVVYLLHIQQHKVGQPQELFYVLIPNAPIGINADVYAGIVQTTEQGNKRLRLNGGFATRKSYSTTLAEKRLHAHRLLHDVVGRSEFAFAHGINGIRIGTIETSKRTALQENHITESGTIESPH